MGSITDWVPNVDDQNQCVQPESSISLEPEDDDSDFLQLSPLVHEWPEDRTYQDETFAPVAEVQQANFQHDNPFALDPQAPGTEPEGEDCAGDSAQSIADKEVGNDTTRQSQNREVTDDGQFSIAHAERSKGDGNRRRFKTATDSSSNSDSVYWGGLW